MYIPLYVKSNYSLLSSMLKIDDIISYSKNNNLEYATLNDTNMFAVREFILKCEKENIKPIISLAVTIEDKEIVLFAKNYDGYKSLIKITTIKSKDNITLNDLKNNSNGLLVVIPCDFIDIYNELSFYEEIYLGYKNKKEEEKCRLITNKVVFFRECLYLNKTDSTYLKYLYLIRDGKTVMDDVCYDIFDHELNSSNVMSLSSNEGLVSTFTFANKCNVIFPKNDLLLPIYKDTKDMEPDKYLFELSKAGLSRRLEGNIPNDYKERLSYELNIINEMGFSNYFLVVYDFIKFAKKNNILVGPGRGSAAGSLVSYALGITDIDPLKYNLLFERFLNPERKTMPDIDTDFPDDKRQDVIDYVISKYGEKNVSGIVTFGTLGIKQVIRDVSRVLNIPIYKVDALSKFIPTMAREKLSDFYKNNPGFKARIDSDKELSTMYEIAIKLEGFPRHTSIHAAGIVMSEVSLDEVIPLTYSDGMYLSGYSMEYLEDLGLLKMDFLGLKNLTIISNILSDIKNNYGKEIEFSKIPLDDKDALNVFCEANTCGIFQFESSGMKNFLKKLKPKTFEDIFAAIALFRPGPADNIDTYIRRKNGLEKIEYLDPCLEKVLSNTYGIIIYQEQIIQVANLYAGYSLGEADILRRAMSKKKVDLLKSEEEKFIKKSIEKGHDEATAKKIFALILKFAGYGFNRSHSVAYSLIAYKMAYLKVHYPNEFFANLLTNVIGSEYKTKEYILEARKNNITIEKPDINLSSDKYVVSGNKIIYPFSNVKQVGLVASRSILKAREEGMFTDIYDAFSRLIIANTSKKVIESLIYSDCFRCFNYNKNTLMKNLDSLFNYAELTKDLDPSLVMKPEIEQFSEYSKDDLLEQEKNVFGFYLVNHPTTSYFAKEERCIPLDKIKSYFNKEIDTIILVEKVKVINTKKGDKMAFLTGSDETTMIDFTLFPKIYEIYPDLVRGDILKIRGNVEKRLDEWQIIVNKIKKLNGDNDEER
ncbi:MAG: DNA polymerase III subunit alpha [Bacilli bacterium]|nr:DNA polymerase III subunit alpha [Bacilli bacterium]